MKRTLALAVIALMTSSVLATAQDANVGVDTEAVTPNPVGEAVQSGTEPVSSNVYGTYGALTTSAVSDSASADLSGITDQTTVNLVTRTQLEAEPTMNLAEIDTALEANATAQDTLHSNIGANAAITTALEGAGYTADDVFALVIESDASVTLYIDDRA